MPGRIRSSDILTLFSVLSLASIPEYRYALVREKGSYGPVLGNLAEYRTALGSAVLI